MEIHPLNPIAYPCQYFVWDSVEGIGQNCYRQIVTEDLNAVTFLARNIRNVNHTYVHADVTDIFRLFAVHQTIAMAVAEVAVKTICISYRNSGNDAVLVKNSPTAVSYAFSCRNMANLKNGRLQCADIRENFVVSWINAIETKS